MSCCHGVVLCCHGVISCCDGVVSCCHGVVLWWCVLFYFFSLVVPCLDLVWNINDCHPLLFNSQCYCTCMVYMIWMPPSSLWKQKRLYVPPYSSADLSISQPTSLKTSCIHLASQAPLLKDLSALIKASSLKRTRQNNVWPENCTDQSASQNACIHWLLISVVLWV